MNVAVFVSGNGTNLQALIDEAAMGNLSSARIVLVVSDKPGAHAIQRAQKAGIKTVVMDEAGSNNREEYDRKIIEILEAYRIELVVLAGFMRILSGVFIKKYRNRILNVHPSILPAFKGIRGIKDAYEYGVKVTGVTVHFVEEALDAGPVILQESLKIEDDRAVEELEAKIHAIEHRIYPEAVRLFADGKLVIEGRRVKIKK